MQEVSKLIKKCRLNYEKMSKHLKIFQNIEKLVVLLEWQILANSGDTIFTHLFSPWAWPAEIKTLIKTNKNIFDYA